MYPLRKSLLSVMLAGTLFAPAAHATQTPGAGQGHGSVFQLATLPPHTRRRIVHHRRALVGAGDVVVLQPKRVPDCVCAHLSHTCEDEVRIGRRRICGWAQDGVRMVVDYSAAEPVGVEGVERSDDLAEEDGVLKLGALAVGGPKMKVQKRCVQRMFEAKGTVLDLTGVYDVALKVL